MIVQIGFGTLNSPFADDVLRVTWSRALIQDGRRLNEHVLSSMMTTTHGPMLDFALLRC